MDLITPLIFITTITTSLTPSVLSFVITKSISDTISAEGVIHYTLTSSVPVVVVLVSEEGDVDLYASPTHVNSHPSNEDHELSSASCGLDMLSLIMGSGVKQYTLGLYGHVRYEESKFTVHLIEPSEEDIKSYQVWDHDPETNLDVLLIDADPMVVLNDPQLTAIIERLPQQGGAGGVRRAGTTIRDIVEFMGVVFIKLCEILIEILL